MKKLGLSVVLTALVALLVQPATAADNGFYLGASVGQMGIKINEDTDEIDFSGDDTAFKVFAGFRFITFLGVEGSYVDLGAPSEFLEGLDATIETDITGYDGFVVGYLPLGIADIFAKAGVIAWDASISGQIGDETQRESDDGTDPAYGIGVQFRIKSFAIRAEFEYFDIEGAEYVYMYSIGGSYTF
jgi:opacity protein-like surface antigen